MPINLKISHVVSRGGKHSVNVDVQKIEPVEESEMRMLEILWKAARGAADSHKTYSTPNGKILVPDGKVVKP